MAVSDTPASDPPLMSPGEAIKFPSARAGYAPDTKGRRFFWAMPAVLAVGLIVLTYAVQHVERAGLFIDHGQAPVSPYWSLWSWLAGAMLLLASVYQAVYYRRLDDRRLKQNLRALENLAETSAAVLSRIGSSEGVLALLPEVARSLMDMSICCITVLDDDGASLRIISAAGYQSKLMGVKMPLDTLPASRKCVMTRATVFIPDTLNSPQEFNQELIKSHNLRVVMQVPLMSGGKIIGVLMMGRFQPKEFSAADVRVAELWGSHAAVALANDALYRQMREALATSERLLQQRDSLFSVHEAISRPGSTDEVLQRIADLAPGPLEVDACQVLLLENKNQLFCAAVTRRYAEGSVGYRFSAEGTNSGLVVRTRQPLVIEQGPKDPSLHPYFRKLLPCGSLVYSPLLNSKGSPMGLLVLMRHEPGTFSEQQLALTRLFSVRAAITIENAELVQQTRRDAETKAMLLRELNHRVKNNLAGIISLLTINEPVMPPPARQWLDRVVERIQTISRTHDMFAGGFDRVSLQELADKTVRSLSVVTSNDISVRLELQWVQIYLHSDRAVSVAMILHELCYNAIVHGLNGSGTVLIRACGVPGKSIAIEVIDNGRGMRDPSVMQPTEACEGDRHNGDGRIVDDRTGGQGASDGDNCPLGAGVTKADESTERPALQRGAVDRNLAVDAPRTNGLGLGLVRGFVTRELKGSFFIGPNPGGGTVARFEFPLLEDESLDPGL